MALCGHAKDLLVQLQRSEWLPPYNEDTIREVIREINDLHGQIDLKMQNQSNFEEQAEVCSIIVGHQCLLRNKRGLLIYIKERMDKIKTLRWQLGPVIPEHLGKQLSVRERDFFTGYDALLTDYMTGFDLDLTADMEPPKDLYVQVRVLQDVKELCTENGTVNLEMNSTHFLRRSDVEHLIRQGQLEQVQ